MPTETYKTIPLRRVDGSVRALAVVDADSDLGERRWHLTGVGYAARTGPRPERRMVYMHREVLGLDPDDPRVVDHINGEKLDNRRSNLRAVSPLVNSLNRHGGQGSTSRFRGVCRNKQRKNWRAQMVAGPFRFVKDFDHEADAALAVIETLALVDIEAAANTTGEFMEALTGDELAAQVDAARRRLLAAFEIPEHPMSSSIGSRGVA